MVECQKCIYWNQQAYMFTSGEYEVDGDLKGYCEVKSKRQEKAITNVTDTCEDGKE